MVQSSFVLTMSRVQQQAISRTRGQASVQLHSARSWPTKRHAPVSFSQPAEHRAQTHKKSQDLLCEGQGYSEVQWHAASTADVPYAAGVLARGHTRRFQVRPRRAPRRRVGLPESTSSRTC